MNSSLICDCLHDEFELFGLGMLEVEGDDLGATGDEEELLLVVEYLEDLPCFMGR